MNFLFSFLIVLSMFALSMLIAYIVSIINENRTKKIAPPQNDAKIYYITNVERKPKPRPKKSTKPNIALKGTIIHPDEFHKYVIDENDNNQIYYH